MPKTEYYAFPDYSQKVTTDPDEYAQAWKDAAKPLEDAMKLRLVGFDPDFQFARIDDNNDYGPYITLPKWFVRDFNEFVNKEK